MSARDTTCPGCGRAFRGERGLRAHQNGQFVTMACRPVTTFEDRLVRENPDIPADEILAHVEDIYAENPDLF